MSKRVLAVGGAGYVGSVLVPLLARHGHDVIVIDQLWFGNHLPESIEVIQRDFFDLTTNDLESFDTVIFLAGLSNDPMADWSPRDNFIANAAGPAFLAYMAKQAGVRRFIHGGSCSVYGNSPAGIVTENAPTISDFPYGLSKVSGEAASLMMADGNFSVISLRKGTVCGWSPRMRFDLIINAMVRDALTFGKINVNNAAIWRPILSIKDAARVYLAAVECEDSISGVFNVANGNYQVGRVAFEVQQYVLSMFQKDVEINHLNRTEKRDYRVSTNKIKQTIGFEPEDALIDIIYDVLEHWVHVKEPFHARYSNIETFKLRAA